MDKIEELENYILEVVRNMDRPENFKLAKTKETKDMKLKRLLVIIQELPRDNPEALMTYDYLLKIFYSYQFCVEKSFFAMPIPECMKKVENDSNLLKRRNLLNGPARLVRFALRNIGIKTKIVFRGHLYDKMFLKVVF